MTRKEIERAHKQGLALHKFADPTEGARENLTLEEALEIAGEDPSLIYVSSHPKVGDKKVKTDLEEYLESILANGLEVCPAIPVFRPPTKWEKQLLLTVAEFISSYEEIGYMKMGRGGPNGRKAIALWCSKVRSIFCQS